MLHRFLLHKLMMCGLILYLVAAVAAALAQAKSSQKPTLAGPAAQSTPSPAAPTLRKPDERPPDLPSNQPVITVRGLCQAETGPAAKAAVPNTRECVITVTKEQFDNLLKAVNPNNQPLTIAQRRQIGQAYVELLVFAEAAKAAGVEQSSEYSEVMRVQRLKTLAEIYRANLAERYRNPSPDEIESYYKENQSKFEGAKVSRIYLPKASPDPQATAEQKQAYQAKAQQVANDIQARATKGEPADKLQKDAYTALGITAAPPNPDLNLIRRGVLPPKLDQEIFSHQTGEAFRADDTNAFMIYRVDSRQTTPMDSVKEEITREIFRRKMEEKQKELTSPVQANYNEIYFGPPVAPAGAQAPNPPK